MAENTKIEWADHTFNPWIGCQEAGPGCALCYARDLMEVRYGRVKWGPGEARVRTSPANWRKPLAWNRRCLAEGRRARVFCASLADVFDNAVPAEWRADLFALIRATPALDWLLLTKRIGNVAAMAEAAGGLPVNVWLGATIVNQAEADRDIPKLLATPATKRFLSIEPMVGRVDLTAVRWDVCGYAMTGALPTPDEPDDFRYWHHRSQGLAWIIVGGPSGNGAWPIHPDWVRSLRDQCAAALVPFLFKQWGAWAPLRSVGRVSAPPAVAAWPDGSIGAGYASERGGDGQAMYLTTKRHAGRLLDWVEHNEFPA